MDTVRKKILEEFALRKKRNPKFSLRSFANFLNISPASLSGFLNGQRNWSEKTVIKIYDKLKWDHNLQINKKEYSHIDETSWDLKNFITTWHDFAILSLLEIKPETSNCDEIADYLGLEPIFVRKAINRMLRMGIIKKTSEHFLISDQKFSVGKYGKYDLIRKRHRRELLHFIKVILFLDKNQIFGKSDLSTMIFPANSTKVLEAKQRILKFRRQLAKFLETGKKDTVYALGIELLPLSLFKTKD